jgi:hypothetical protein
MGKGRPPGSINKVKAGAVFEQLQAADVDLVQEAIKLLNIGDSLLSLQVIKLLMKYVYAERRPEDYAGNVEEGQTQITAVMSARDVLQLIEDAKKEK